MAEKYLVTGGAGFIGSHLVDRLCQLGKSVTVLDLLPEDKAVNLAHQKGNVTYIEGDIRNSDQLDEVVAGHTHIVHLAALVSVPYSFEHPVESHATNVTGTLNVFEAARKHGVEKVVYASSAAVYGDTDIVPIPEDAPLKPFSPYGQHKLINELYGELYAQSFNLPTVGLRFFNVFGTRQDPDSPYSGVVSIFVDRVKKGEPVTIYGDGSHTRDFVHVDNIVDGIVLSLEVSDISGAVFNLGSGEKTSLNELVKTLGGITGNTIATEHLEPREGDIQHSCATIDRAKEALGYKIQQDLAGGLATLL